jgi:hypothetical protein
MECSAPGLMGWPSYMIDHPAIRNRTARGSWNEGLGLSLHSAEYRIKNLRIKDPLDTRTRAQMVTRAPFRRLGRGGAQA